MEIEEIINETKKIYKEHDDLEDMIEDLTDLPNSHTSWAHKLATEDYGNNTSISKELYQFVIKNAEGDISILSDTAENIAKEDGLNEKEWAKEICKELMLSDADYNENMEIARLLESLGDSNSAQTTFNKALEQANDFYNLFDICKMYVHGADEYAWKDFSFLTLNDDDLARIYLQKTIDIADCANELQQIADIIGREKDAIGKRGLNDKAWAREILKVSYEMNNDFYNFKQLAELLIDDDIVDMGNTDDENWIKEIYKKGLDVGDASDKKDLRKAMKDRGIKLK